MLQYIGTYTEKRNEEETYTHFERDIRGKRERKKKNNGEVELY